MTTENVTVLFTDLVGSTELTSALAPDAADELRRKHFSALRQAIAASGGTEVKNLGDGLMVVFPAASSALACAVAMQQAVRRDSDGLDRPLQLRVGLSAGEATREASDYFGDPVVEAARLCARANAGQILASDLVRANAGRRSSHTFAPLGPLELKGLPEPIETLEVEWEPIGASDTANVPLPRRMAPSPAFGIVGRTTELEAIEGAFKRVQGGEGRELVLVYGEAGLGKTTVVAQAARCAFEAGALVLFGHAEEDLASPYQLFSEALSHYAVHAPEERLRALGSEYGPDLARLVPTLSKRLPDLPAPTTTDADTERYLLFAAVVGLLSRASEEQPIVLVFDDLQWTDKGSLQLLRHLVSAQQTMNLLVLGTYRDTELSRSHPLVDALAAFHRLDGVSRIELRGLDDRGVLDILEAAAGHRLDDDGVGLAHAVHRETDGNPFFVSEVLRNLAETGAIYQDETGRWVARHELNKIVLPESVRTVIGARVGRLGERAERILSLASVIGREFDLELLARSAGTTEDDLLDLLEAATAAALLRVPTEVAGQYVFAHALIQHALYEDLGPNRRARAHRKVAETLEDLRVNDPGRRVGELARHWVLASQPVDVGRAMMYCREAGDEALAALAPGDALNWYTQALDLYPQATDPDPVLFVDLLIGLGTAQRQVGDPSYRDTLIDAARRAAALNETSRLVTAALANDRGWLSSIAVLDTEKVDILELVLDRLSASHPDRALVLATLCSELALHGAFDRRKALADQAESIVRSSGDDPRIVRVLNGVAIPLMVPSMHEESLTRTADALERAERVGDPFLRFFAAHMRANAVQRAGDLEEVDRCLEIQRISAQQLDQPMLNWVYRVELALRALITGETDLAEQFASEALEIGSEGGEPDAAVFFSAQLASVGFQRGSLDDLVPVIEDTVAEAPDVAEGFRSALALAHAEADRTAEASLLLRDFADCGFALPWNNTWTLGMTFYAEAAIAVRDPDFASPILDRLAPWAGQWSTTGVTAEGPIALYVGGLASVLGRYDEAESYFDEAAAMNRTMGAKFFSARTDLAWGRMLIERQTPGDADSALEHVLKAQTTARECGYANVERRATEALQLLEH